MENEKITIKYTDTDIVFSYEKDDKLFGDVLFLKVIEKEIIDGKEVEKSLNWNYPIPRKEAEIIVEFLSKILKLTGENKNGKQRNVKK